MAKAKTRFQCSECGSVQSKWVGQCPDCQAWNTLSESRQPAPSEGRGRLGYAGSGARGVVSLASVVDTPDERRSTGLAELDRVLGGGLVSGSVVLIGGDPGIGKSTLLLQALAHIRASGPCLYVTGEESLQQIAMRSRRLGLDAGALDCQTETSVEQILATIAERSPGLVVIDSIQTLFSEQVASAPGSVTQVRECAAALVRYAKQHQCTMLLVGHVTKDGALAGPRVLEHMVDAVLYFESDSGSRYRVVRSVKNRFGTVNELGLFAMTGTGLKPVSNPSAIFLSGVESTSGSVVTVIREGTRPLLLELQALVDTSHLANPRRVALGLDHNRLAMLLAVLHRHAGISMSDQDVFINVVGGIRLSETSCDLPVALAVMSSFRDRPLPQRQVCFGEVGLGGEIRPVYNGEERLKEAQTHGFSRVLLPAANAPRQVPEGMEVVAVKTLGEALERAFD
ncbi:DNA repair protein RadA [Marinihelvus fidelis]|uniref:DNA repair protein RadA n=1 Tax=Marinihelvus fidelis TaxID=2613842 RepID=A0A5N0TF55_9GAMM|nr:DNA repair protein RadA [Marinihelvus fidelis]KAA9131889.1 DNA repair protein RadA [Marinihelvus fidelis]